MSDFNSLVDHSSCGDAAATARLIEQLMDELRSQGRQALRKERPDHTLNSVALVNEAWIRLRKTQGLLEQVNTNVHLKRLFAVAMQNVLVDHARARRAVKRGGETDSIGDQRHQRVEFDVVIDNIESSLGDHSVLELQEALEKLKAESETQHELIIHRFFGGRTIKETAPIMNRSTATLNREFQLARAKLWHWMNSD